MALSLLFGCQSRKGMPQSCQSTSPVDISMEAAQVVPNCPSVAAPAARSRQRAAPCRSAVRPGTVSAMPRSTRPAMCALPPIWPSDARKTATRDALCTKVKRDFVADATLFLAILPLHLLAQDVTRKPARQSACITSYAARSSQQNLQLT